MNHEDPFTQGAQDCRANNLNRAFAFEGNERLSYEMGWDRAFGLALQRLNAAELLPAHFTQERTMQ
jgi:hypothetical protein